QAPDARPGKRAAVITANAARQAVVGKRSLETTARVGIAAGPERVAPQDEPRAAITQRQRVTVAPIPGAKLALEVGGPRVIGSQHRLQRSRHRADAPRPPTGRDQTRAAQEVTHGRATRPRLAGIPFYRP